MIASIAIATPLQLCHDSIRAAVSHADGISDALEGPAQRLPLALQ